MKKIILICDRCGKQYNKWNDKGKELYGFADVIYDDFEPQLDIKKDLCERCYLDLEKWWKFSPAFENNHRERSFA